MGLKLDVKVGDSVSIDEGKIIVSLMSKTGQLAKLDIAADKKIKIEHIKMGASHAARKGLTVTA